uniref:MICOS complex subunit MIC10 n=1 Tax=Syphacia muris TaxID=451379 RepID=A0A0N5B107_9BILA
MSNKSENELGEKLDRCLADSLLKIAGGAAIGIIASVALFKSRSFPIWFGSGIGLGMGWNNCRHDLQNPYVYYGKKISTETQPLASANDNRNNKQVELIQDALSKMRVVDDKILFELNVALPSHSFSENVDKGERCKEVQRQLLEMRTMRMNLIQRCIKANQNKISEMRKQDLPPSDIRIVQNTLRLIRSELDVEGIVNERSEKAIHDRCRTFS